jgi:hypothetical protein
MSKHLEGLKNPMISQLVINKLKSDKEDLKSRGKNLIGAGSTIFDEALFNIPSKNGKIKGIIEEYKGRHPHRALVAKGLGFLGSGIAPGAGGVKVLSLSNKLRRLLKSGGIGQALSQGAVYGGAPAVIDAVAHGKGDTAVGSGVGGAVLGAGTGLVLGKGGAIIKRLANAIRGKSKIAQSRELVNQMGKDLYNSLSPRDIKVAKAIRGNPIESSDLNLNTLLHRGTENTKAIIDGLYQKSPKAREIIARESKKMAKGQMPHIEETIIKTLGAGKRPNTEEFVGLMKKQADVNPLYEKAYKDGIVNISERLKGNQTFKKAWKKAVSEINDVDKGAVGHEPTSVRVLDKTKRNLDDEIRKFINKGEEEGKRDATIAKNMLIEHLDSHSPAYTKARATSGKYLKIGEAAQKGKGFKHKTVEETEDILKNMTDNEKYAYKLGTLENLLKQAEDRSTKSELGQYGKDITNPQVNRLLKKILGEKKTEKLSKSIDVTSDAIRTLGRIDRGSQTATHESNKMLVLNVLGAIRGKTRSLINLADTVTGNIRGVNAERAAKTQMNMLLKPERLLKYETKKVKRRGTISPKAVGIVERARERDEQ